MTVTLRDVTRANWFDIIDLKVAEEQRGFVASNLFSLAQAKVEPSLLPLGIFDGETLVGFTMFGIDPDDGNWWIHRLMIDARFQRQGHGRTAMQLVLDRLREQNCPFVLLGVEPANQAATRLYEGLGFVATGDVLDGEAVMRLDLA